jgi:hypothetical protein
MSEYREGRTPEGLAFRIIADPGVHPSWEFVREIDPALRKWDGSWCPVCWGSGRLWFDDGPDWTCLCRRSEFSHDLFWKRTAAMRDDSWVRIAFYRRGFDTSETARRLFEVWDQSRRSTDLNVKLTRMSNAPRLETVKRFCVFMGTGGPLTWTIANTKEASIAKYISGISGFTKTFYTTVGIDMSDEKIWGNSAALGARCVEVSIVPVEEEVKEKEPLPMPMCGSEITSIHIDEIAASPDDGEGEVTSGESV